MNACKSSVRHQKYRVLLVITHVTPGGTREVLELLAHELQLRGFEIRLVAIYRGSGVSSKPEGYDVLVDDVRLSAAGYAKAAARLIRMIRSSPPDIVLSFLPAANIIAGVASRICGVPRRIASHHSPGWVQHSLLRTMDRALGSLGFFSDIVCVSRSVEASFASYPRQYLRRISVIANGIRPVAPKLARARVRQHYGLPQDAVVFTMIGRLSEEKNVLNAVRAAARTPGAYLALAGDGPLREAVQECIRESGASERIVLVGSLDHQNAIDLLAASDVFVQISFYEGRSLAMLEAIAIGRPVIASDIPAQREALTLSNGNLAGLVCDPADIDSISAAMGRLVSDAPLRQQLSASVSLLKDGLDLGRMGDAYASLLTQSA